LANKLALEIERILADEVGEFIATATKLPELAEKINKSVSFFSGKDTGKSLEGKIRALEV